MVFQKKKISEAIKEEIEEKQIEVRQIEEVAGKPRRPLVMPQLPTRVTRKVVNEETGETFEAVSYDEALQEILETIREIKKAVI